MNIININGSWRVSGRKFAHLDHWFRLLTVEDCINTGRCVSELVWFSRRPHHCTPPDLTVQTLRPPQGCLDHLTVWLPLQSLILTITWNISYSTTIVPLLEIRWKKVENMASGYIFSTTNIEYCIEGKGVAGLLRQRVCRRIMELVGWVVGKGLLLGLRRTC